MNEGLKLAKLTEVLQERFQMQLDNPLNELGVPYTQTELLDFAIDEAYQNDELDFILK